MKRPSPIGQLVIFVIVLVALNVVFQILGIRLQFSIIGSIVLTVVLGLIGAVMNRKA